MKTPIRADLVDTNVVVFSIEDARLLFSHGFYGKPLGVPKPKGADFEAPLILDMIEANYLAEKGVVQVHHEGRPMQREELAALGNKLYTKFPPLYAVYRDLRERGFVVTPGIKFGSDFAVYKHGPGIDHAPYIVQVKTADEEISSSEVVRAGRLATTVRKNFIIAVPEEGGRVRYLLFSWVRL
ncbi:MAG: tRNA-intron lyase [Aigarchaeota archaeon]|nr:tRNA-intron lyase [Candidatus Calditenuaceae archaeon]